MASARLDQSADRGGKMQILLIEDDATLGAYIQKALRQQGHIVDHQVDGRAGLIKASSELYHAIILDRMLPNVDGMKILQTLRATGDQTPVLMLSRSEEHTSELQSH